MRLFATALTLAVIGCSSANSPLIALVTPEQPAPAAVPVTPVVAPAPAPVVTPTPPATPATIGEPVTDAVWSDATHLVIATAAATYRLDVATRQLQRQPDLHLRPKLDNYLTIGSQLARVTSFGQYRQGDAMPHVTTDIYDVATLQKVRTITHELAPEVWSPSHALFVETLCDERQMCAISIKETLTGATRFRFRAPEYTQVEFEPSERYVFVRELARGHRLIYRLGDGHLVLDVKLAGANQIHGGMEMVAFDGDRAVMTSRNTVHVYDLTTGKHVGQVSGKTSPGDVYGRELDPATGIMTLTALPSWTMIVDTRKLVSLGTVRMPAGYHDCTACATVPLGRDVWAPRKGEHLTIGDKKFAPGAAPQQWTVAFAALASGVSSVVIATDGDPARCTWTTGERVVGDLPCPDVSNAPDDYAGVTRLGTRIISPDGARIAIRHHGELTISDGTTPVTLGVHVEPAQH